MKQTHTQILFTTIFLFFVVTLLFGNVHAYELDLSGSGTYQRGNNYDTIFGGNAQLKIWKMDARAMALYTNNGDALNRRYELNVNVDYNIAERLDVFAFIILGHDSKKNRDYFGREVIGLSKTLFEQLDLKYSLGVGHKQENKNHISVLSQRLKWHSEDEWHDLLMVMWHTTNLKHWQDYEASGEIIFRLKPTKSWRVGLSTKYEYDNQPLDDVKNTDMLTQITLGFNFR